MRRPAVPFRPMSTFLIVKLVLSLRAQRATARKLTKGPRLLIHFCTGRDDISPFAVLARREQDDLVVGIGRPEAQDFRKKARDVARWKIADEAQERADQLICCVICDLRARPLLTQF